MNAPLRDILHRRFIAYSGTQITLSCGHVVMSYSGRQKHRRMRCEQCAEKSA